MKVNDILVEDRSYLYEGLTLTEARSVKLWETAGHKISEAALTADQIQQLFQQVEQGATAAGGNRTMVGQGKDLATAVKKAYDDLASKVQNSGPVQNVDQLYAQAAEKLKQATGGDAGAMQYVQKYRDFAKKHPVAQSLIYSALIAAAGISGAGLGGAAALGLFKMVDKLLQGEKFSTAAGKGLETGAMAYAAGQVGKALQGGEKVTSTTTTDTGVVDMPGNPALNQAMASGQVAQNWVAQDPRYADTIKQIMSSQDKSPEWKAAFGQYLARNAGALNSSSQPGMISNAIQTAAKLADTQVRESINLTKYIDRQSTVRMWALKESLNRPHGGMQLTEAGVSRIFSLVEDLNASTGTPNPKAPPPPEEKQDPEWTGRKEAPAAKPDYSGGQRTVTPTVKNNPVTTPPATTAPATAPATEPPATTAPATEPPATDPATTAPATATTQSADATTRGEQNKGFGFDRNTGVAFNSQAEKDASKAQAGNDPATTAPATDPATTAPTEPAKKGMLGRAADWAKTKGANLTNKVTADKLNTAWKKAGSPMDSDKLAQVLQGAGVDQAVIDQAYKGLNIPTQAAASADATNADPTQAAAPADATKTDPTQAAADATKATANQPGQEEPDPIKDAGNWLKGRIPGTDAYNQRKLNKQDDAAIMKTAQGYVTQWTNGTKANPALNTPEELQKFGQRLATQANGKVLFNPALPKDMSQAGVTQYLKDIVARTTSGLETGNASADTSSNATGPGQQNWDKINKMAAGSDTETDSSIVDQNGNPIKKNASDTTAQSTEKEKSGTPAPDAHDEKDIEHDQVPGMEIVQQDPIIVKYKNKEYGLNDNGEWVHLGGTKTQHQSFQAMLDKTAGFSESFDPGKMLWDKMKK